jgi:hypothetical protein
LLWTCTRHWFDLTEWVSAEPGRRPRSRQVVEPLLGTQVIPFERFKLTPPTPPPPHHRDRRVEFTRAFGMVLALSGFQADPPTLGFRLAGRVASHPFF